VCRLRSANGFSYGLALCEADRLFLFRTFSQETKFDKCNNMCPVTVHKWCGYCRFRTCLSTKGFRFFTEASTRVLIDKEPTAVDSRKRKYSGKGILKELNFIPDSVSQDSVFIPQASSPGPGFGCPTPAQAKQVLDQGNSTTLPGKPMSQAGQTKSLAEANPNLLQALTQPIATNTSYNQTQAQNFAKPSFNLRPGTSKAEMASNGQARVQNSQGRGYSPHPGLQPSAFTQQQTRAYTPIPTPTSDFSRATSTPLTSPGHNQLFMPPTSVQQNSYNQFPPNMTYQLPGAPGINNPQVPQVTSHSARNLSQPYPTPQSRMYHNQQAYFPQVRQSRPKVPAPYFNGSALGTKNKKMSGDVGLLMDPVKQDWVKNQQEKYLRYHLRLYRGRGK